MLANTLILGSDGAIRSAATCMDAELEHAALDHDPAYKVDSRLAPSGRPTVMAAEVVSEPGADCLRIRAQFPANREEVDHDVTFELEASSGSTAFGVMDPTLMPRLRSLPATTILQARAAHHARPDAPGARRRRPVRHRRRIRPVARPAGRRQRPIVAGTVTRTGRRHGFRSLSFACSISTAPVSTTTAGVLRGGRRHGEDR